MRYGRVEEVGDMHVRVRLDPGLDGWQADGCAKQMSNAYSDFGMEGVVAQS